MTMTTMIKAGLVAFFVSSTFRRLGLIPVEPFGVWDAISILSHGFLVLAVCVLFKGLNNNN